MMTDAQIEAAIEAAASEIEERACWDGMHGPTADEIAAIIRRHITESASGPPIVACYGSTWYIVREVLGGHEYLWNDGKWHEGNCDRGYWSTREAAIEFIRKVAGEVGK